MTVTTAAPVASRSSISIWIWIGTIALSFLAGRYLLQGHGGGSHSLQLGEKDSKEIPADAVVVTTTAMVQRDVQRSVQAVGTFFGFEELTLSSKQEGRVAKIHFDQGAVVKPGDLLLELESTDFRLALEQADRSLQTELAKWGFNSVPPPNVDVSTLPSVVSAKLRFELAQSRLTRMLPLQASNSISADDLEQARSDAKVLESEWKNQMLLANAAAATARLRAADLEIAKQRLADCEIRVPVPTLHEEPDEQFYTISERLVTEGTLLRPGTEVFKLVLGKSLKLRLAVPESNASKIAIGQNVLVAIASSTKEEHGVVTNISPAIERNTRTFQVEVTVPNDSGLCKPGGFAKAQILVGEKEIANTVPPSSLYSLAGIQKIFLIENGIAKEIRVTLGEQTRDWIEIASPALPPNARVATSGQRLLSDGIAVVERDSLSQETQMTNPKLSGEESRE
ncbi:MAG: efflux RND transporter periplasmic adaptor subunit [Pirellula sp.]|nr:efflux RND transporter periplasmic adaptor subunit [Pirellula sp.]